MDFFKIGHNITNMAEMPALEEFRSMLFGDGFFETIRFENNQPLLWNFHLKRIKHAANILDIKVNTEWLKQAGIKLLIQQNTNIGIIRFNISRISQSAGYLPINEKKPYIIATLRETPENKTHKLFLSSYKAVPKSSTPKCAKWCSSLHYILAKKEAVKNNYDDALIANIHGFISETASANIFWEKNGKLFTPSDKSDPLHGIVRTALLEKSNIKIEQDEFSIQELLQADSVFITNSTFLCQHVDEIKTNNKSIKFNINNELLEDIKQELVQINEAN